MKRAIAGLIAGLVLGTTAVAGAGGYWKQSAGGYTCEGHSGGALCVDKQGSFNVAFLRGGITVYSGTSENPNPFFTCKRYGSPRSCSDLRP